MVIEFVKGTVDYISPQYVSVAAGAVGYQLFTPNPFRFKLNDEVKVYTYQHVRQDAIILYGFTSREERELFIRLLNVTGIGPKSALAIIASGQLEQLVEAIEAEDERYLVQFPSVGKKTARQMILDLKGKLDDLFIGYDLFKPHDEAKAEANRALDDAIEALKVLGYAEKEIEKVKPKLAEETMTTDQYMKRALQLLLK